MLLLLIGTEGACGRWKSLGEEDEDERYERDMVKKGDDKLEGEETIGSVGNESMLSLSDSITRGNDMEGAEEV